MHVDEKFMREVGLGEMPEDEKRAFMEHAEEELEVRVGQGVGASLTNEQMDEFEQIAGTDAAADWLERNAPDFRETVARVFYNFKDEIRRERDAILA